MTKGETKATGRQVPPVLMVTTAIKGEEQEVSHEEEESELLSLLDTAGLIGLLPVLRQELDRPDPRVLLGSGKIRELKALIGKTRAEAVIFNQRLNPTQCRNLEEELGKDVIDRTELILDIFARRAHSSEGKIQVELARLQYLLPRLGGRGAFMSRLGGGIATRGPGEQKIEVDRRVIRLQIGKTKRALAKVRRHRQLQRDGRKRGALPIVSLVGYTNSGKTTLLNMLTDAGAFAEEKLFATLDPLTRLLSFPSGRQALLTDTVGFIRELPVQLLNAFHATLEEVLYADLLVHVVDSANPAFENQMKVVAAVLEEIGAAEVRLVTVFNKIDLGPPAGRMRRLKGEYKDSVAISAIDGGGRGELLDLMEGALAAGARRFRFNVPYRLETVRQAIFERGRVLEEEADENGYRMLVQMEPVLARRFKKQIKESQRRGK